MEEIVDTSHDGGRRGPPARDTGARRTPGAGSISRERGTSHNKTADLSSASTPAPSLGPAKAGLYSAGAGSGANNSQITNPFKTGGRIASRDGNANQRDSYAYTSGTPSSPQRKHIESASFANQSLNHDDTANTGHQSLQKTIQREDDILDNRNYRNDSNDLRKRRAGPQVEPLTNLPKSDNTSSMLVDHDAGAVDYGDDRPRTAAQDLFAADELNNKYNEHVKRKEEIRRRIEDLMREKEFLTGLAPSDVAYMNQKKKEYELERQRSQMEERVHAEAEEAAGLSPEKLSRLQTKEDRVTRHKKFLETQKGQVPVRTIRFDRETQRTHHSQFEEGEELVQVLDEKLLGEKERKELMRQRDDMRQAREQHQKDLLGPLHQARKLDEERVKELGEKLTSLRKENNLRHLDKGNDDAQRMDVHAIWKKFEDAWPEFQRKQVDMEKTKQDMHKKYVEMHLMYSKYLIDEDHDTGAGGGLRADVHSLIKEYEDNNQLQSIRTPEDLSRKFAEVQNDEQARIDSLQGIQEVFGGTGANAPKVYSDIVGLVAADGWHRSREAHQQKLKKYREQKDYQIFIEEDEVDVEAEQVYSNIKNLHEEKFYQLYFFHDLDHGNAMSKANREQIDSLKAMEGTLRGSAKFGGMNDTFGAPPGQGRS